MSLSLGQWSTDGDEDGWVDGMELGTGDTDGKRDGQVSPKVDDVSSPKSKLIAYSSLLMMILSTDIL